MNYAAALRQNFTIAVAQQWDLNELRASHGLGSSLQSLRESLMTVNGQLAPLNWHKDQEVIIVVIGFYVNDFWRGELGLSRDVDTTPLLEHVRNGDSQAFEMILPPAEGQTRTWQKVHNFYATAHALLHDNLEVPMSEALSAQVQEIRRQLRDRPFDASLARDVHRIVMHDCMDYAGEYRTIQVQPLNSNVAYATPSKISQRLDALFAITQELMPATVTTTELFDQAIKVAGVFFREFLLIHPFRNGNGRVARLLLSYLLRATTAVPVSLFINNRAEYIEVLENCPAEKVPWACIGYILRCCLHQASQMHYLAM
ncbi:hypothetical protein CAOG_01585 [Capsaspora owczarzaki ATCC 30864]|uniref:Fido domain-containing protein n=1 Tax=Capsaspora owczarzaki (strain ATCC 30864) TaxID=595528 RepID=A0A0D2U511_CAPO3|nr:hypothetical protein CAOG_01585 [Capsaspora owczarzaki ATCC 30864]KJE90246.1 hypothetical protein CAOG_001585 [Capsaspora owczarzaki ATCC 30864]|eukprot:XP_004364453.1 hypothetical protein CAOG_01585 [Capsaspora owczarzaki ATCC 30864]